MNKVRAFFYSVVFLMLSTGFLSANGKKPFPILFSVHLVSPQNISKRATMVVDTPMGKKNVERIPVVSIRNITAYYPFKSSSSPDVYGMSVQLDKLGSRKLRQVSGSNGGGWLVVVINQQVVDMLKIDKQVDGRIFTVWRGLSMNMLDVCNRALPRIGESKKDWKKRIKKLKKLKKT